MEAYHAIGKNKLKTSVFTTTGVGRMAHHAMGKNNTEYTCRFYILVASDILFIPLCCLEGNFSQTPDVS